MRAERTSQTSIFDQFAAHDIGRELQAMSELLDAQPGLLDGVAQDLGSDALTGRRGMTAESVLRCALLKQYRQLTYEELAFHLLDSASFQAFARLPVGRAPSRATLQANISAITDPTWEAINQQLLGTAYASGVERGTLWRVDSTAIEAPIHEPSDSSLLLVTGQTKTLFSPDKALSKLIPVIYTTGVTRHVLSITSEAHAGAVATAGRGASSQRPEPSYVLRRSRFIQELVSALETAFAIEHPGPATDQGGLGAVRAAHGCARPARVGYRLGDRTRPG